jgi:hypothetical protein
MFVVPAEEVADTPETETWGYKGYVGGGGGTYKLTLTDPSHNARPYRASFASARGAEEAARLHDCFQLLLHGAAADTNLEWSSYTLQEVQRAAAVLAGEGWDVHAAVRAAQKDRGSCAYYGVSQTRSDNFQASCRWPGLKDRMRKLGATIYTLSNYSSAAEAAHAADMAALLIGGLEARRVSFPATSYDDQQLRDSLHTMTEWAATRPRASRACALALAGSLQDNLECIQQARPTLPWCHSLRHPACCLSLGRPALL